MTLVVRNPLPMQDILESPGGGHGNPLQYSIPASPALLRALGLERTIISFSNIYNYTSSLAGRSYLNREGWEEVKEERAFECPKLSKDDVEVGEGSERLEGRRWWGEGTKKRVIGAWSRSYGLPLLMRNE